MLQFALIDGNKAKPLPRLQGTCCYCGEEMVAKCGQIKIWHWAHKSRSNCDPWWSSEGEWHMGWKNLFPDEWQEVIHTDEKTGERHIADVKTPKGLVIEFQHSPIKSEELQSREAFYENMIWIVDGDRGTSDGGYFFMSIPLGDPIRLDPLAYQIDLSPSWWDTRRFLFRWAEATAPVFFDFGESARGFLMGWLWRIVEFRPDEKFAVACPVPLMMLIEACEDGEPIPLGVVVDEKDAGQFRRELKRVY